MRTTFLSASLVVAGVSALPSGVPNAGLLPALPLAEFEQTPKFVVPLKLDDILSGLFKKNLTELGLPDVSDLPMTSAISRLLNFGSNRHSDESSGSSGEKTEEKVESITGHVTEGAAAAATCSNVRVRQEWDSYSNSDRQAFVSAVRCLQGRPASGQFRQSRSRYEDLVALHQTLTPNVHGNAKFLLWHRYYLWTFEQMLRSDCGFAGSIPWFDETRYAGRFAQSSIFSSQWLGSINVGGNCVTDGQFANLAINVGPGQSNTPHCLSRNNDNSRTQFTSNDIVNGCNNQGSFADMASCSEGGAHAWGHNGIGAVMQDTWASPADPIFWLHHAFVDRNYRIWQNRDSSRLNSINGVDAAGNALGLDTTVNVYDFRPTVRVRDILDTTADTLCYKYSY